MNKVTGIVMESQDYYQSNKRRIWVLGAAVLLLTMLFSVVFITKTVTAQRDGERVKLVTSIEVKKGDTLWSIASDFYSDEYDNINQYIEEIKDSNGMVSDVIRTGNFIIVPYYADTKN